MHVGELGQPADGGKPLEWLLLTSVEVKSRRQAVKVVEWYRARRRIKEWRRVLKSGCNLERLGMRSAERIERAATILAVIAWRLAAMAVLGHETPELPANIPFSNIKITAVDDFAKRRKLIRPSNFGSTDPVGELPETKARGPKTLNCLE